MKYSFQNPPFSGNPSEENTIRPRWEDKEVSNNRDGNKMESIRGCEFSINKAGVTSQSAVQWGPTQTRGGGDIPPEIKNTECVSGGGSDEVLEGYWRLSAASDPTVTSGLVFRGRRRSCVS